MEMTKKIYLEPLKSALGRSSYHYYSSMTIAKISMKFRILMSKGNGALKLLMNNMPNWMLTLTDATLLLLKQKHPESKEPPPEVLIEGPIRKIHPVVYNDIDKSLILKASMLAKGGSGPSSLDAWWMMQNVDFKRIWNIINWFA